MPDTRQNPTTTGDEKSWGWGPGETAADVSVIHWPAADNLTTGQETYPRGLAQSSTVPITSQQMRLTYFTARKTDTVANVAVASGNTAAGATPTLVRLGLYTVAANGDLTLAASTANDTTLFAGTNTLYTKALTASLAVVAGQRLAIGILVVTGAATPQLLGISIGAVTVSAAAPRLAAAVSGQADLPASVAAGSVSDTGNRPYAVLLP